MLYLSISQAQPYFEYLGYGISVLALYLILRKSFKSDIKEVKSMINLKADKTALEKLEKDTKKLMSESETRTIAHLDTRFEDFKDFMIELIKK